MAWRTFKNTACRGILPGLFFVAPRENIFANHEERFSESGWKIERSAQDISIPNHGSLPVGKAHFGFCKKATIPVEVHAFDFEQVVRDLGIESACIHAQGTSERAWNTGEPLQTSQATFEALANKRVQNETSACGHSGSLELEPIEMLEMNDNAVKSGIAHQDVGASTQNESGDTAALNELIQPLQIFKVLGADQKASRTANTIGGPVFEWLVFENVALNLGAQCLNSQAAWQLDHSVEGLPEDTKERFP
jgi:hypothetical protein